MFTSLICFKCFYVSVHGNTFLFLSLSTFSRKILTEFLLRIETLELLLAARQAGEDGGYVMLKNLKKMTSQAILGDKFA